MITYQDLFSRKERYHSVILMMTSEYDVLLLWLYIVLFHLRTYNTPPFFLKCTIQQQKTRSIVIRAINTKVRLKV